MSQIRIESIQAPDLPRVGEFLHANLNKRISAAAWIQSLTHPWSESRPNYGVRLLDGEELVGVFCAIYSDQWIDGKAEKFCNPHSWCVLEAYRSQSINLVLNLVRQRGYHFTMLTPNPKVAEIFRHLRFKDLAESIAIFPNLAVPRWFGGSRFVESSPDRIATRLPQHLLRDFALHREIPWLNFVAFGRGDDVCLIAYKPTTWKKLPCAGLIHISDPAVFDRHIGLLRSHLLYGKGLLICKVEERFLGRKPQWRYRFKRTQGKLFMSTLPDSQIRDLYSELASLDV